MAKEFPEGLDPTQTPLTGSERLLVDKGTATLDDVKAYVGGGSDDWSTHPASQDVDMVTHRITSLGAPAADADAATKKYVDDQRALVEWWEPTWTPVSNVDSVSNVECSYTRVRRAAGGSLVTLEGTIEVTPTGEDQCVAEAPLPVPLTGSDLIFGTAVGVGHGTVIGGAMLDSGKVQIVFDAGGSGTYQIPFRISYRAA